jgi:arabinogalactan oligomer/maltooligosaccharide transport system permease protein
LAELSIPAATPLEPTLWDVDEFRQSRGLITASGTVDEGRLGELAGADASRMTRSVGTLALLSLGLLAFVGLGYAARTGAALVEYRAAYAYTMPALIGMLLLVFFPFFYGIALSFTNANLYNTEKSIYETWVGLQNYGAILSDFGIARRTPDGLVWNYQNFYYTLLFTIVWTISNVAIGVTLGLILALILNLKGFAMRPVYRVLLILPWAMPNYITALIFQGMFHRQFGVINQIIQLLGGPAIPWFDQPFTSFLAVLTTNSWLSFPFMMVISLGALQSIPADLYEAARVDGASRWQQFTSITLPSLRPALIPAIILSVVWTFNQFNVIYLVSAGQPAGATEILITQSFKLAFEQYRYGYAAAYSTIIFLILLIYGTWQNRVTRATEAIG